MNLKDIYSVKKNFAIPGGKIDLIMEHNGCRVFVEVKDISSRNNIHDYITPKNHYTS